MYGYHIVAVYPSLRDAERAKRELIQAGVHESSIHLSSQAQSSSTQTQTSGRSRAVVDDNHDDDKGFFHWLFGDSSPDREREWYTKNLEDGRVAMSVMVHEDEEHIPIAEMMVRAGGLDLEDESRGREQRMVGTRRGRANEQGEGDEVIPVYKEELAVGKRATENRYRVRAHVVERPVEEQVNLRDERVVVERRPASRDYAATGRGANAFEDRDYEVIERHEEPVVEKRMRAAEEVVVRRDARTRTETVRDKIRETEVEMDGKPLNQNSAGNRSGSQRRV
jgi:stress response protein YsnF